MDGGTIQEAGMVGIGVIQHIILACNLKGQSNVFWVVELQGDRTSFLIMITTIENDSPICIWGGGSFPSYYEIFLGKHCAKIISESLWPRNARISKCANILRENCVIQYDRRLFSHCSLQQQHPANVQLVTNMNITKSQLFTILPITMISMKI
jgi:hypothetical protein